MTTPDTTFELVLALVAAEYHLPSKSLQDHNRLEDATLARHTLWYILREVLHWSFWRIAKQTSAKPFCGTAVMAGVRKIVELPHNDKRRKLIAKLVEQAQQLLDALPSFDGSTGSRFVVQHRKTGDIHEVYVEQLTKIGDGVKLRLNGDTDGKWSSRSAWLILERVNT